MNLFLVDTENNGFRYIITPWHKDQHCHFADKTGNFDAEFSTQLICLKPLKCILNTGKMFNDAPDLLWDVATTFRLLQQIFEVT